MRVRYVGRSFGIDSLTDGKIYEVLEVEPVLGALRVVDDSEEDYLYSPTHPKPLTAVEAYGRFEIIQDNESEDLKKAIYG